LEWYGLEWYGLEWFGRGSSPHGPASHAAVRGVREPAHLIPLGRASTEHDAAPRRIDSIPMVTTVDYPVIEIVTVGESG
jgi:hypothetical protein